MGFFTELADEIWKDLSNEKRKAINEILEAEYEEDDENVTGNYRDTALKYSESNHGWYTCPKCGRRFRAKNMDADHIVPKSKGGDNTTYNMQLLCKHCNRSKQADTSETSQDIRRRKREIEEARAKDVIMLAQMMENTEEKNRGRDCK